MLNKKVIDLVNFAEKALNERWGYAWGGSGEIYTLEVAEKLCKAYVTTKYDKTYYLTTQMNLWKNRRICDCSGLLRAFGASGTANSMYQACKEKGSLKNWTAIEGYLVFCQGSDGNMNHIGVVVSNGYVIHSTNSQKGVIKEKLATSTRGWTHYGKASFIDYGVEPSKTYLPDKKVTKTSTKDDIKWLQEQLNNYDKAGLAIDGIYGAKTLAAHQAFNEKIKYAVI